MFRTPRVIKRRRKRGRGAQCPRRSNEASVQRADEERVPAHEHLLHVRAALRDLALAVEGEAVVAENVDERSRRERLHVPCKDCCARVEMAFELVCRRDLALAKTRIEVVEAIEVSRANFHATDDLGGAAANGLLFLWSGRFAKRFGAAREEFKLPRCRRGECRPEELRFHERRGACNLREEVFFQTLAGVPAKAVDEHQVNGTCTMQAGHFGREVGHVEDHARALARVDEGSERLAVRVLETPAKFRVCGDGARVVEAACDGGVEGNEVVNEESFETRQALRPLRIAKRLHPNGPRVEQ